MAVENLAEARDETEAFRAFLDSPVMQKLLAEMTDIGIGVVGRYFAVTMCDFQPNIDRLLS